MWQRAQQRSLVSLPEEKTRAGVVPARPQVAFEPASLRLNQPIASFWKVECSTVGGKVANFWSRVQVLPKIFTNILRLSNNERRQNVQCHSCCHSPNICMVLWASANALAGAARLMARAWHACLVAPGSVRSPFFSSREKRDWCRASSNTSRV